MKTYNVLVTWTVNKVVEVKANSFDEARNKLKGKSLPENPDVIEGTEEYTEFNED